MTTQTQEKAQINKALFDAALTGDLASVKRWVEAGADVKWHLSSGWTPLLVAVQGGNAEVVRFLAVRGGSLNATLPDGTGALTIAALQGKTDVAHFLVEAGADVNAATDDGRTPLMASCINNQAEITEFLTAHGAQTEQEDARGLTALAWAARCKADGADHYGYTPLMWAVQQEDLNLTRILVEHGANVNAREKEEISALDALELLQPEDENEEHRAARREAGKLLAEGKYDVHVRTNRLSVLDLAEGEALRAYLTEQGALSGDELN